MRRKPQRNLNFISLIKNCQRSHNQLKFSSNSKMFIVVITVIVVALANFAGKYLVI